MYVFVFLQVWARWCSTTTAQGELEVLPGVWVLPYKVRWCWFPQQRTGVSGCCVFLESSKHWHSDMLKGIDTLPIIRDLLQLKTMQSGWPEIRIAFLAPKHTLFIVSSFFSEFTKISLSTEIALTFLSLIFQMASKVDQTGPSTPGQWTVVAVLRLAKRKIVWVKRSTCVFRGLTAVQQPESTEAKLSRVPHLCWATGSLLKSCPEGCMGCKWCKYILLQDKNKEKRDATQWFHRAVST